MGFCRKFFKLGDIAKNMVSLRELISENRVVRRVNNSRIGQAFERSDFVMIIEASAREYKKAFDNSSKPKKVIWVVQAPLVYPLMAATWYALLKLEKWEDRGVYEERRGALEQKYV